jgi:adenylyltransferase/sulfurtransferase
MATLRIPTPLRSYTNGQAEVSVRGANISEAMEDLMGKFPTLKPHLYNGDGNLRPFVNLFLGENNITDLQGLETPLDENARVILIPSIAGGKGIYHKGHEALP